MPPNSCNRDGHARRIDRFAFVHARSHQDQAAAAYQEQVAVPSIKDPVVVDDNERNAEEAEAAVLRQYDVIDLTEDVLAQHNPVGRGVSLGLGYHTVSVYKLGQANLEVGTCVELREPLGRWRIRFLEVRSMRVSQYDGSLTIRGLSYTRNRNVEVLENKRNEVCQVIETDADDQRADEIQGQMEISAQHVLRVRTLNKTNADYPRFYFGGEGQWLRKTPEEREDQAPLTSRWKYRVQYRDARFRNHDKPDSSAIVRLTEAEADERFRVSDKETRVKFRGTTYRGGSHKPEVVNLEDGLDVPAGRSQRQYTYADMFCGGGGASRGAVMAGFKLVFGVDRCRASCATWRLNFPGARLFEQDMAEFIHSRDIDYRSHPIDLLHLSPPCQFWSPLAYAQAGRSNEENMAILFSCSEIIDKMRSRVFTLEQTFGLTHDAHVDFLNALVRGFTAHRYSVKWKIVSLVEYGLPQTRKRLVMIGACPGEQLPPWPPATHSSVPARGLKPYATEARALQGLDRPGVTLHDVANACRRNLPPRNPNVPFPRTITCGGTQSTSHSSGLRDFTVREIASLQGFPISHQFVGNKTVVKRQIGNAFPPCVVKAFYDHLRTWLQQVDGIQSAAAAPAHVPVRQVARPVLGRGRSRPRASSAAARRHINGDLDEDEALRLALRESMRGPSATAAVEIHEGGDEQRGSPVSSVAPMLERMSIAPSDAGPPTRGRGRQSTPESSSSSSRSRSATLGSSPGPSPGPSRHRRGALKAGSRKRSIGSMRDGEADEAARGRWPPKRERVDGGGGMDEVAPSDSARELLSRIWGASEAQASGDDEWTL